MKYRSETETRALISKHWGLNDPAPDGWTEWGFWVNQKSFNENEEPVGVYGQAKGFLAIHEGFSGWFIITHLPTGGKVLSGAPDWETAKKAADIVAPYFSETGEPEDNAAIVEIIKNVDQNGWGAL